MIPSFAHFQILTYGIGVPKLLKKTTQPEEYLLKANML
jgi:hypothetical protein